MIESKLATRSDLNQADYSTDVYDSPYALNNGCLSIERRIKDNTYYEELCNFAPRIVSELTVDDGATQTKKYLIGGTDEEGEILPLVEVDATEFDKMNWMRSHWSASLDMAVRAQTPQHVRHAIRGTARFANQRQIFTHTGWQKVNGTWEYLLPGHPRCEVQLQGKQQKYAGAVSCTDEDLYRLRGFLCLDFIPHEIMYPCLALVFLSPLNEFLRTVGHEPKFILTLLGRTGSMKSTVAALMTSFFGQFSATDLPMSFRDTANSIIHNAFALKDVLTCVDDYHPTSGKEACSMRSTMQTLARGYGDRAARNRLTSDITLREARPPQGNVIVTAEFPPDIGESGTARLFFLEMRPGQLDLRILTEVQEMAASGLLMRCMFAYTEWLRRQLSTEEAERHFLEHLKQFYERARDQWRTRLKESNIPFHDRLPDTLACLEVGFSFLMNFLQDESGLQAEERAGHEQRMAEILLAKSSFQAEAVEQDRPAHIFIRKLFALMECGQATVIPTTTQDPVLPSGCFGYEDEQYYYLFFEVTHKAVKHFCEGQGESFSISSKALGKALADEGLINTDTGTNTRPVRFGQKTKRVLLLCKDRAKQVAEEK